MTYPVTGSIQAEPAPNGKPARAGSLIVTFKSGLSQSARTAANRQLGAQSEEQIGHGRALRVQVEPGTLSQALAAYAANPDVEKVEPDYLLYAAMTPNDPRYGDEWGMGQISAPSAWDRVGGASGVKVAVLDTGIGSHPDLNGRVVAAADFTGSPYGAQDRHGHGTHTAGTVAAIGNNGVGVTGVAWSSSLLIGKVLGDSGAGSLTTVAAGMVWAADNGAKVISMSLGANLDCSSTIQDAADYAWSKGVVIVAAAGNDGLNDVHTPANCNHIVPVGATDQSDARAIFSNYGPGVPISAPGVMVISTSNTGDYLWMSGTSMATPHVAGVAALVWASAYGTSNQAVISRLFSTADRVAGTGNYWVYGRVNAAAAVGGGAVSPTPTPSPTPSPTPPPATVSCNPRPKISVTSARSAPGVLTVTVTAGTASQGTNRLQQLRFGAGSNAVVQSADSGNGQSGSFTISLPNTPSTYSFTIRRSSPGATVTVPLTVVDSCGDWSTFVGGGPNAF
ncbi:MAG: S8 family peptidase [Chloroflexota bacterium]